MSDQVEEAQLEIAGQKIHLRSVALNTLLTLGVAIATALIGWTLYVHLGESKEANRELVGALKEMTQAAREQNCLMRFDTKERQERAEFCKQISR